MSDELAQLARLALELPGGKIAGDTRTSVARVIATRGFSNWDGGRLALIDRDEKVRGSLLGRWGAARLAEAVRQAPPGVATMTSIDVNERAAAEAGLSCGGQAEVLIQPLTSVPERLWERLARRAPVALLSPVSGTGWSTVVEPDGAAHGPSGDPALLKAAVNALAAGQPSVERLGDTLLEVWVPEPRVVTVGSGELASAIKSQCALLGWEGRLVAGTAGLGEALAWAGESAAVVVLSHDPHIDVPTLAAALGARVAYIGALGSRRTQSRRTEQLLAAGVAPDLLERIHRPIGLDLGGRRAPEVAMAICAEILACRHGRDGRSLRSGTGPIHDRPWAWPADSPAASRSDSPAALPSDSPAASRDR